MAEKKKASSTKVTTKVVASTDAPKKTKKRTQKASTPTAKKITASTKNSTPKKQRDNYFVGAWRELKQVRWPNRKDTWGLTFAVIVYSLFFFVLIIVLDAFFKYLFDLVVGG